MVNPRTGTETRSYVDLVIVIVPLTPRIPPGCTVCQTSPRCTTYARPYGLDTVFSFHRNLGANAMTDTRKYPYPHAVGTDGVSGLPAGYTGPLPGGAVRPRPIGAGRTPVTSQTRQCISRKSLREIPPDDARLSQVNFVPHPGIDKSVGSFRFSLRT